VDVEDVYGAGRISFSHHSAVLGVEWEHPAGAHWVRPFVRGELGLTFGFLGLGYDVSGDEDVSDWAMAGRGHAGVGVRLVPFNTMPAAKEGEEPRTGGVSFGIDVEVGYTYASPLDFDDLRPPEPDEDEDPPRIPLRSLAFGSLDLSGVEMRIGALIRF